MDVFCTQCGAVVDGKSFCSTCGKPVSHAPPPPPQTDFKGPLVVSAKTVNAPFDPRIPYAFVAAVGVLLVALGMAIRSHSHDGILFAGLGIFCCFSTFVGVLLYRIPRKIRVYECGLELDIRRSFNKSMWLPWAALIRYKWEGDVIRYDWQPDGIIVLANGRERAFWPIERFPRAARIPQPQVSEVTAFVQRHAPPPRP